MVDDDGSPHSDGAHDVLRRPDPADRLHLLKLYDVVRSAHLERIRDGISTTVLYRSTRYDFEKSLADRGLVRRAGTAGAFMFALSNDVDVIEVNEPLIARAAPRALAAISGNRLRSAVLRRVPARVVTYAIGNKDPRDVARSLPLRSRIKWHAQASLIGSVWRRVDRIAYGTSGSRDLYAAWFRGRRCPESILVPALPNARQPVDEHRGERVVYLGDLAERKGFWALLAAWPEVVSARPSASLLILGKGRGETAAADFVAANESARMVIDPPRDEIFARLAESKVLVLPSQASQRWREQVGLPIVEGLSVGCEIVTTSETGLAEWLRNNGHRVVPVESTESQLAEAIVQALDDPRPPRKILDALPARDGRMVAEEWLLRGWTS